MKRFTSKPGGASRGFSLVEMLVTMLILSFVMTIVVSGATVAQKLYRNTMAKADAQMILSQIERALRDDLSFADECMIDPGESKYADDGSLQEGAVKRYHKNGFWYELQNGTESGKSPYENFLYKTFSAAGDETGTFQDPETPVLYEPLSASNSKRLEELYVPVPDIVYLPDGNCFHVSNLRVKLDKSDETAIAGSDNDAENAPYLIIRALNQVKCGEHTSEP